MITVNHVMSNNVPSPIFNAILGYFKKYSSDNLNYVTSITPCSGALIRHYHRPNLENDLLCPCIVTVHHDLRDTEASIVFERFEDKYRSADVVVCLNTSQQQFLADHGLTNTIVVPHGYNNIFLRPIKRRYDGRRPVTIGIFSRRYARKVKGEAYIYELVKRLNPKRFHFLLVGRDRYVDAKLLNRLGFNVKCYESLPYPVLCDAYKHVDILLIASTFEGGPANVPEAIATGTPIFSSPVGMSLDLVNNGRNGHILSMDTVKDSVLFQSLCENSGQKLNSLFEGAIELANSVITWRDVVMKYEDIYKSILNKTLRSL